MAEPLFLACLLVCGSLPLVMGPWLPTMDGSEHTALVDVLVRLWRHDPLIMAHYTLHLQPVGYHLFYLIATPLAWIFGAAAAVWGLVAMLMVGHVLPCYLWLRRRRLPSFLAIGGLLSFYGHHFTYGFYPTLMAGPMVLLLVAELGCPQNTIHPSPARWFGLFVLAGLGSASHIIFAPLLVLLGLVSLVWHGRRMWLDACAVAAGSLLILLPTAVTVGRRLLASAGGVGSQATFDSYRAGISHLHKWLYAIDKHAAMTGNIVWIAACVLFTLMAMATRRSTGRRAVLGCLFTLAALCVSAVWWIPYGTSEQMGTSLLLNVRWLCILPWLLALMMAHAWSSAPGWLRAGGMLCACLAASLVLTGATRLALVFNRDVASFVAAVEQIPKGSRLCSYDEPVEVGEPWPMVRFNMSTMAFVGRLSSHSGIFIGNHLPIDESHAGEQQQAKQAARLFFEAWRAKNLTLKEAQNLQQSCDVGFFQQPSADGLEPLNPAVAHQLAMGRAWRLVLPAKNL